MVLTLMEKPDRLDDAAWYDHWYDTQTPMSTEIQPAPATCATRWPGP